MVVVLSVVLLQSVPLFADQRRFDVRDFGASGNKTDDATPAFAKAIDQCRKAGGGVVYVGPGNYRCLPLVLCDNITLEIDAGATLFVDLQNPAFAGNGFIRAENARNITIEGHGTIDGQAQYAWENYKNDDVEIAREVEIARKAGVEMKRSYRVGNVAFMFLFKECRNIRIKDITAVNSSSWCMRLWGSRHVVVDGVTIRSDLKMGVNSDGIDIDGTRDVQVHDCNISTGDDAICIKSGTWSHKRVNNIYESVGKSYPSENIAVDHCILTSSSTAMMIGTETCSDIRHVAFRDCVISNSNKGFGINVQDGATVSDISYANITMDLRRRHWNWWGDAEAFYFVLKKRLPDSPAGRIKNITIDNVMAHAEGTSRIVAMVDRPLENISIRNFQLFMEPESTPDKRASSAITIDGATNLRLQDVAIHWNDEHPEAQWQSALALTNVDHFQLDGLSVRQGILGSQIPAVVLENTSDGIITDNRALPGTSQFFQIDGPSARSLRFHGNVADGAASDVITTSSQTNQLGAACSR